MDKKKVMGHNPLGMNHLADAKFKFIPYTESGSAQQDSESKKKRVKRKVVSYYLEEDLITEIRDKATENSETYSGFVGRVLKKALHE
jgi:uncharacterized protein (DUF1919 family)